MFTAVCKFISLLLSSFCCVAAIIVIVLVETADIVK
jgi:hypothetical protein